jgi:hypothetical protein
VPKRPFQEENAVPGTQFIESFVQKRKSIIFGRGFGMRLPQILGFSRLPLVKNDSYLSSIDVALIARLISGCIENDIELDIKVVGKCLYGTYKKDKLLQLIEQGNMVYKEIKQQYGQKHGNIKIK